MGLFDVPTVKRVPGGILALVLNFILGGLGFLIWAFITKELGPEEKKNSIILSIIMMVGWLLLGLGHLFAIIWAIIILVKGTD